MARAEELTVLVVEDEPDVRLFLQTALEDAGFNVVTAEDGETALELIRERKPDFISLDLILPRKSGPKVLYELRRDKELSKIPVLIVTAHAKTDLGRNALEELQRDGVMSGAGAYLEKPVKATTYVRRVQEALGVEPAGEESGGKVSLKEELNQLMGDADADALREALKALKKQP